MFRGGLSVKAAHGCSPPRNFRKINLNFLESFVRRYVNSLKDYE
jgi:hypothetical protein